MRIFNLLQPGVQLPMTQRAIPPRAITVADARVFFQYQHEDKVAEALSDHFGVDIDVFSLVKVDSVGDVFFRRDDIGSRLLVLADEGLTELALTMGWRDWIEPNYPPLPRMR